HRARLLADDRTAVDVPLEQRLALVNLGPVLDVEVGAVGHVEPLAHALLVVHELDLGAFTADADPDAVAVLHDVEVDEADLARLLRHRARLLHDSAGGAA